MVPHRELARYILELSEDCLVIGDERLTLPEGMSQAEYEEIAIKQIKEYVSKKLPAAPICLCVWLCHFLD